MRWPTSNAQPTRWERWALEKFSSQRVGSVGRWGNFSSQRVGSVGRWRNIEALANARIFSNAKRHFILYACCVKARRPFDMFSFLFKIVFHYLLSISVAIVGRWAALANDQRPTNALGTLGVGEILFPTRWALGKIQALANACVGRWGKSERWPTLALGKFGALANFSNTGS